MTPAQKKNAERFKKAAAEAKKIRAKNPRLTQAQAVKQAWAILYKTGKVSGAKKTATKKKAVKKKIVKKSAPKKSVAKSYHKDTKSHNVRISVVSGTNAPLHHLTVIVKEINSTQNRIESIKKALKESATNEGKKHYKFWLNRYKLYLRGLKKQLSEAKKHIK